MELLDDRGIEVAGMIGDRCINASISNNEKERVKYLFIIISI